MEFKPLDTIKELEKEVEELKNRCSFYESERKKHMEEQTELKFKYSQLESSNQQLQWENQRLKSENTKTEQKLSDIEIIEQNPAMPEFAEVASSSQQMQYNCPLCNKRYVRPKSLQTHLVKIHQVKSIAGQKIQNPSGSKFKRSKPKLNPKKLNRHKLKHKEPYFICPCCVYKAKYKNSLRKHVVTVHRDLIERMNQGQICN